ncbi:hypothetical protein AWZ03_009808 [Drosophila navojoa]|uniref:Uncharacterized protein n=1 Tax=Drosophila navojoa TaxID=7232 RepID=A0A484B4L4_DRONA|nr:hypothetical protein AWZ03_009808 [Drosophila navojoa]
MKPREETMEPKVRVTDRSVDQQRSTASKHLQQQLRRAGHAQSWQWQYPQQQEEEEEEVVVQPRSTIRDQRLRLLKGIKDSLLEAPSVSPAGANAFGIV